MPAILDNPIKESGQDLLEREKHATALAIELLKVNVSEGLIVGILGKWGTGKTSFLNLMRPTLLANRATIVDFNPWMFSGSEQLADLFFSELAAQLKPKKELKEVAFAIEEYGESMSSISRLPFVGSWFGAGLGLVKVVNKIIKNRRGGLLPLRTKVKDALEKLDKPVVVFLDDVDRLTTAEIRDVFKLVRSTASFPNLIYALAFDRTRVEGALAEQGVNGRDYLEKILQLSVDLPSVPEAALQSQLFAALDAALADITTNIEIDGKEWPGTYLEIVKPLIRNMRDVRRYTGTMAWVFNSLEGRVSAADVLGLEALRIFLPDAFQLLQANRGLLTSTGGDSRTGKKLFDSLSSAYGEQGVSLESILRRLFPAASQYVEGGSHYGPEWGRIWIKKKRVASEEIFRFYLERAMSNEIRASAGAEAAVLKMGDFDQLAQIFNETVPEDREALVKAIEAYEDDFRAEHVVPTSAVILNSLPTFPDRKRGFFELDAEMVVGRVVYRLVKSLDGPDQVMAAVKEILPKLDQLSQKLQLITIVGYRENAGHKLVTEEQAKELEQEWRDQLREASTALLAKEKDLLRVFYEELHQVGPDGTRTSIPDDPQVTHAILRSSFSETKVQAGDNPVEYRPRLMWDVMAKIYGSEDELISRIEGLISSKGSLDGLLQLAKRYAEGWRPSRDD